MAKKDLKHMVDNAEQFIYKDSATFRKWISDYRTHAITVGDDIVLTECQIQCAAREGYTSFHGDFKAGLKERFGSDTPWNKLDKKLKEEVPKFVKGMYDLLEAERKRKKSQWSIKWKVPKNGNYSNFFIVEARNFKDGAPTETFKAFKQKYKNPAQIELINAINAWSIEKRDGDYHSRRGQRFEDKDLNRSIGTEVPVRSGGTRTAAMEVRRQGKPFTAREGVTRTFKDGTTEIYQPGPRVANLSNSNDPFADIGHAADSHVSGERKAALSDFLESWPGFADGGMAASLVKANMQEYVQFNAENKTSYKGDMSKITNCGIEASDGNKKTLGEMKNEVDNLNKEFTASVLKAVGQVTRAHEEDALSLAEFEASDSFKDMVEKKTIEALVGPLRKKKSVKVKTRLNTKKQKNSKSSYKGKKRKQKIKVSQLAHIRPKKAKVTEQTRSPRKSKSGPANAPLFLLGVMKEQLPTMVQNNMGEPALTNRTGQFASSVRPTDIAMTPKGFPSIGYTYQRDPYEVHEQDSNFDPRKLIDRSMREIAAEYAIGRFYTRRV